MTFVRFNLFLSFVAFALLSPSLSLSPRESTQQKEAERAKLTQNLF